MNSLSINSFIGLVGLFIFSVMASAQAPDQSQAREQLLEIAHAVDLEDERLTGNWERLKQHSEELFPVWVELIQASNEDRVLEFSLLTAESASATKAKELIDLAVQLLGRIDSTLFPLATQSALHTLAEFGDKSHVSNVQRFVNHPNIMIQSAAKKALQALTDSPTQTPKSTLPSSTQTSRPSSSKPSTTNQTGAAINAPASSTPWSVVAVVIVAAIGLLWLLLKRRS